MCFCGKWDLSVRGNALVTDWPPYEVFHSDARCVPLKAILERLDAVESAIAARDRAEKAYADAFSRADRAEKERDYAREVHSIAANGLRALQAKVREWEKVVEDYNSRQIGRRLIYYAVGGQNDLAMEMRKAVPENHAAHFSPATCTCEPEPEVCPACQGRKDGHEHLTDEELSKP
jgi:hypothetical protein